MPYFDSKSDWQRVLDTLLRAGERGESTGLDTEFYGFDWSTRERFDYDPSEISPIGRTRIQVWSVAVGTGRTTARGYEKAHGACLPEVALDWVPFRDWLESDCTKDVHNLGADAHTLWNHGISLGGGRDTVALARWCWPERVSLGPRAKPFALKTLARDLLGYTVQTDFEDFMEPNIVPVTTTRSRCVCGLDGCRKRKDPHGQYKVEVTDYVERGKKPVDLTLIVPGHPLFERWWQYSEQDAVWAKELDSLAFSLGKEIPDQWS